MEYIDRIEVFDTHCRLIYLDNTLSVVNCFARKTWNFKCQTLTKEINTVPDIYASVKEIHVHLQYAHLRLGFFESHVSHRIDHCSDVWKCFITYVPIHMRGKILTFQIWRFMDNQSSLGGPLSCCEKLCVNEMLYFFCTHQLSSVNKMW